MSSCFKTQSKKICESQKVSKKAQKITGTGTLKRSMCLNFLPAYAMVCEHITLLLLQIPHIDISPTTVPVNIRLQGELALLFGCAECSICRKSLEHVLFTWTYRNRGNRSSVTARKRLAAVLVLAARNGSFQETECQYVLHWDGTHCPRG